MPGVSRDYQLFVEFLGLQAHGATNNVQYALGTKSVDIPVNADLMQRFLAYRQQHLNQPTPIPTPSTDAQALDMALQHGWMSESGVKTGVIHCQVTYPQGGAHTASTVPLAREMEAHIGLILNAIVKATAQTSNAAKNELLSASLQSVKTEVLETINRSILIDQITWLAQKNNSAVAIDKLPESSAELAMIAKNEFNTYIRANVNGQKEFNQFLSLKRLEYAKKAREQIFNRLYFRQIINTGETTQKRFWRTSQSEEVVSKIMDVLPSIPSTYSDSIDQNSCTGQYITQTATPFVAHNKQLGKSNVGLMRIVTQDGNVIWRVPSIAATDAYRKQSRLSYREETYVNDAKDKLDYISSEICASKNGGDDGFVYYNLLTSYGCTPAVLADNHQSWSTQIIVKGVHAHNKDKVKNLGDKTKNLVLLCNLSVNQWGQDKPGARWNRRTRGVIDEIHDMVDLSIIQLIDTHLGPENRLIRETANEILGYYKKYLTKDNPEEYYTKSEESDKQAAAIDRLRSSGIKIEINETDTAEQKAAKVILKMFINNTYCKKEYGMLMQAMMVAAEKNKVTGCKSANERFASVVDKSIIVNSPAMMKCMDDFIKGTINEDFLYAEMLKLYNNRTLYEGPGTQCSLKDQAALPKAKTFSTGVEQPGQNEAPNNNAGDMLADDEAFACGSKSYDTNAFEHPRVDNLFNDNANKLQAHKVGELVRQSFHDVTNIEITKNALLIGIETYNQEQLKKQGSVVSVDKQKERNFKYEAGIKLMNYLEIILVNIPAAYETQLENIRIVHNAVIQLQTELNKYPNITPSSSNLPGLLNDTRELCFKCDGMKEQTEIPDQKGKLEKLIDATSKSLVSSVKDR